MRGIKSYIKLSSVLMILAVVALVLGIVFVQQGVTKADWMKDAMRQEQITLGLDEAAIARGEIIDNADEAKTAADTIREHRRAIAPTYGDLLGSGRYDPTNPQHLKYTQAMNMENYLYMAVLGFGVTDIAIAAGAFMIVMGIALGVTSVAINRRKTG